jgi:hypothetical protein
MTAKIESVHALTQLPAPRVIVRVGHADPPAPGMTLTQPRRRQRSAVNLDTKRQAELTGLTAEMAMRFRARIQSESESFSKTNLPEIAK